MKNIANRFYKPSEYERKALEAFNADLRRVRPAVSVAQGTRAQLVRHALRTTSNRFQLCRQVARLTRALHDPISQRFPASINRSLSLLASDRKKLPTAVATQQEAA